jgi:hypothetical protein
MTSLNSDAQRLAWGKICDMPVYFRSVALAIVLVLALACGNPPRGTGADGEPTSRLSPAPPATAAESKVLTATAAPASGVVLHWMSLSGHSEPRYRLFFEGGEGTPFTELRLVQADGTVVAAGLAAPSANEPIRLCGRGGASSSYGPLRVTLALQTQEQLSDLIRHPESYAVDVLANRSWIRAGLVNECHAQE